MKMGTHNTTILEGTTPKEADTTLSPPQLIDLALYLLLTGDPHTAILTLSQLVIVNILTAAAYRHLHKPTHSLTFTHTTPKEINK